jgi:tRNA A22 N-methylase
MTSLVEVVNTAVKAVGTGDADWRVQAGAATVLVVAGIGGIFIEKIRRKHKAIRSRK